MLAWNCGNVSQFTCKIRHWNRYMDGFLSKLFKLILFVINTQSVTNTQCNHRRYTALCAWPAFGAFTLNTDALQVWSKLKVMSLPQPVFILAEHIPKLALEFDKLKKKNLKKFLRHSHFLVHTQNIFSSAQGMLSSDELKCIDLQKVLTISLLLTKLPRCKTSVK